MARGRLADPDRSYALPPRWAAVADKHPGLLEQCRDRALTALAVGPDGSAAYFDPAGGRAGALFNTVPDDSPDADDRITTADLLAAATVSSVLPLRWLRHVLEDGDTVARAQHALRRIPTDLSLGELDEHATVLTAMADLNTELRRAPTGSANHWVLAAKVCARKRPGLFPIRDSVVCSYLAGTPELGASPLGPFRTDLQVFAFVVSDPEVRARIAELRAQLEQSHDLHRVPDLRLLDVALWQAGQAEGLLGARGRR